MSAPEPGGDFAAATRVTRVADGRYDVGIAEGWEIAGKANGGYLLAIASRAVVDATGLPDPLTVTGHFVAPAGPGPGAVAVDVVRSGGRHATASYTVFADGAPVLVGVATTTDLARTEGPLRVETAPPDLPPVEECVATRPGDAFVPPFVGRIDVRLHPDDAAFFTGNQSGDARMRGWFRLRDGEPLDTIALVLAVDAFPPTSFNARLPRGWTPTMELTAHIRHRPTPGWLACAFVTRNIAGGYLETDGEIWDGSGSLVAQSRQLQLIPRR